VATKASKPTPALLRIRSRAVAAGQRADRVRPARRSPREVGAGLPTAMTIASRPKLRARLAETISTDTFRAYTSTDIVGVEVGGATTRLPHRRRHLRRFASARMRAWHGSRAAWRR